VTYRVNTCVACSSSSLEWRAAIIAPFVAARVFKDRPKVCRIAGCKVCGLIFFEDRYEDAETARLYAEYRTDGYYHQRHYFEPWYTRRFNDDLGGRGEIAFRRDIMQHVLAKHASSFEINTVLDFGGDRGQIMTGGPGSQHYVYDISGVEPDAGVINIPNAEALGNRLFDLILICEVLEHASNPLRVIEEAAAHLKPGGLLYVSTPNAEFPLKDVPVGNWYASYLRTVLYSRWTTISIDLLSTAVRTKFGRIPTLGFVKMHEHINFFDRKSMRMMAERIGLKVLSCETYRKNRALYSLCQRSN
jgi:SAM-dependent methyltransferase